MNSPLRVGIVGCGGIAQTVHLPTIQQLDDVEVRAAAEIASDVREGVGRRFGIDAMFASHEEMLDSVDLDLVAVLTMDHVDVCLTAAQAGAHVFVEKPIAFTTAGADLILESVSQNNVRLFVGYMKHFDVAYRSFREEYLTGDFHHLALHNFAGNFARHAGYHNTIRTSQRLSQVEQMQSVRRSAIRQELPGLSDADAELYEMLLMLGSHDLAAVRRLNDASFEVHASIRTGSNGVTTLGGYDDGTTISFSLGATSRLPDWDESVTAFGDASRLRLEFGNPFMPLVESRLIMLREEPPDVVRPSLVSNVWADEWRHIAKVISDPDVKALNSGVGAAEDVRTAQRIMQSLLE